MVRKASPQASVWSRVRGFNYQPSYTSSGLETWRQFDASVFRTELARGKRYFPGMNTVRLWLSWDAFIRGHNRFAEAFESALAVCDDLGLKVVPVLFNRWHDYGTDFGGIYIDHFLPGVSWIQTDGMFEPYVRTVVGEHASDARILCWDLCNEPFSYTDPLEEIDPRIVEAELAWLTTIAELVRSHEPTQPIGVSSHHNHGLADLELVEPISDVLLIHPYSNDDGLLDKCVELSRKTGKPLLATETCWGAVADADRVQIIRRTLPELAERGIGFLPHLLHHSMVSDGHRPEFGSVDRPGFHFIDADGSLRPGHEAFNDY